MRSISREHKTRGFRLVQALGGVIALRPVLIYYAIEIGSSLFLLGSFGVSFVMSSMWIYHLYL
jgi:hypothetical protein